MTLPLQRDMAAFIDACRAADEQDAPFLVRAAQAIRESGLELDALAVALDAMASRMTRRIQLAQRWDDAGMLAETDVDMRADDFARDKPNGPIRRKRK